MVSESLYLLFTLEVIYVRLSHSLVYYQLTQCKQAIQAVPGYSLNSLENRGHIHYDMFIYHINTMHLDNICLYYLTLTIYRWSGKPEIFIFSSEIIKKMMN